MKKIFISQEIMDTLFAEGKAELNGDMLTIHSRSDQIYKLVPAYKFLSVADDSEDKSSLLGKIYAGAELEKIGADVYMDSAIVHDVPYQVEQGFIGVPQAEKSKPETAPKQEKAKEKAGEKAADNSDQAAKEAGAEVTDEDLLSDYLMKIL